MIYFQHSKTRVIYTAYTLREQFIAQWNGCGYTQFDRVIASIVYGNDSLWPKESRVIQFLGDYEVLIPEYNVFGKVAETVLKTAV